MIIYHVFERQLDDVEGITAPALFTTVSDEACANALVRENPKMRFLLKRELDIRVWVASSLEDPAETIRVFTSNDRYAAYVDAGWTVAGYQL